MFAAYVSRYDGTDFSFDERDDTAGIIGTYKPFDSTPVVTAATFDELEHDAWAYLGRDPESMLYLTDDQHQVRKIMICRRHHEIADRLRKRLCMTTVVAVLGLFCLVWAAPGDSGPIPLLAFLVSVGSYLALIRLRLFNPIEGAVVTAGFLFLVALVLTATQSAR